MNFERVIGKKGKKRENKGVRKVNTKVCLLYIGSMTAKNRKDFFLNSRGEIFPGGHNIYPCKQSYNIKRNWRGRTM